MRTSAKSITRTDELLTETNLLLKIDLILFLAEKNIPHQTIRKIIGCDMKLISQILKPLKGKFGANS